MKKNLFVNKILCMALLAPAFGCSVKLNGDGAAAPSPFSSLDTAHKIEGPSLDGGWETGCKAGQF
ncbi:MAG: hypothetical protein V4736_05695, partial [Bdellovibrionota bacterium]